MAECRCGGQMTTLRNCFSLFGMWVPDQTQAASTSRVLLLKACAATIQKGSSWVGCGGIRLLSKLLGGRNKRMRKEFKMVFGYIKSSGQPGLYEILSQTTKSQKPTNQTTTTRNNKQTNLVPRSNLGTHSSGVRLLYIFLTVCWRPSVETNLNQGLGRQERR